MLMARELGPGGTERQLTEVARSLDRSRFDVHVGYFREGVRSDELRGRGVSLLRLKVTSFVRPNAAAGAWQLGRYLRKHHIRLVHTYDYPLNCFGVPVARAARVPVVLSSQRGERKLTPAPFLRLLRATDRLVTGIVVNSEAVRKEMLGSEHVAASRLHLCYNGVDTAQFHSEDRVRVPALAGASLVIGVVSLLRPEKSLETLIEAFAKLPQDRNLRLAIVGSGPELKRLAQIARERGVFERCVFQPSVADVARWLKSIDIFVLPSVSEALSNSLMEAMACGCACVASRTGGNPELIREGETGLLFAPRDSEDLVEKLEFLVDEPALRCRLAETASRYIRENFSLAASVSRMQEIYTTCLSSKLARSGR